MKRAYGLSHSEAIVAPPDGAPSPRLPLSTALLFSVANLGANLVFAFFNFAMPQYLDSYHLSPALIGLLANERSFIGGFIQPFVGRLSDRARTPLGRRRPFFLIGVPLAAVALLVLGLHPPFAVMIAIVPIAGFFLFIAYDPYLAMMADITPATQRGRVGAVLAVAAMLGNIVFSLVAGFLWSAHEFTVFLITVAGLVVTFGITFVTVREPLHPVSVPPGTAGVPPAFVATTTPATIDDAFANNDPQALTIAARRRPQRSHRVRGYLRDLRQYPVLARYVVALSLFYLGAGGATPFITLFATKALGVSSGTAFFLLIILVLCSAIGAVPAGLLADRIGKKPVLIAGLVLFALGTLGGSRAPSVAWEIPAMVLVGLGNACPNALVIPLLADLVPPTRVGEFIGLASFVWSIAQPIGSFCAGLFVTSAAPSTYRHTFIWAGVLIALAAVAMVAVQPSSPPPLEPRTFAPSPAHAAVLDRTSSSRRAAEVLDVLPEVTQQLVEGAAIDAPRVDDDVLTAPLEPESVRRADAAVPAGHEQHRRVDRSLAELAFEWLRILGRLQQP